MATIRWTSKIGGVLTDVTSVVLCDPGAVPTYGLRRMDTSAVIAAADTAMTKVSTGTYEYEFTPVAGVSYQGYVKWTYGGETHYYEVIYTASDGSAAPAPSGSVPIFSVAEVLAMVAEFGVSAVFRTYASIVYDDATGKVTRGSRTNHSVTVTPPNADGKIVKQFGGVDGVKESQLFSIVASSGLTFTPDVGQEFVWDGKTWAVTWVNPLRDSGSVLAYQFGIKGT